MPEPGTTLRIRFTKLGKIRFTSHRDVARAWERALRRSGLRVAYSEGFSPRPLLSFGLALPTGCESLAEYLDVRLDGPLEEARVEELAGVLGPLLPDGLGVDVVATVEPGTGSLQQEVTSCTWDLEVLGEGGQELADRVERLLGSPSILIRRERKGRQVQDDLRPSVLALSLVPGQIGPTAATRTGGRLKADLATQPRGVRPQELLQGLGGGLTLGRACRTHQWIDRGATRDEPLSHEGSSRSDRPRATEHV